jgi:hypothetical protein
MCRPSNCNTSARTADAVGLVVMVVIGLAVIGVVLPVVTAVAHVFVEVIKLAAVGIASGAMLAAITWLAVHIVRAGAISRPASQIRLTARQDPAHLTSAPVPVSEQSCLTCGDKGRIIRAIGNGSSVQVRPCPECQPAQLTR